MPPRYRSVPPAASSAGREAADLLTAADRPPDGWQADALVDGLAERDDGRWAASEVGLIVPRQNGKGDVLLGKALHSMFLSPVQLILWSAHEFKTAREMFLRTREVIDGCYDLRKRVKTVRTSHGEEGIELHDGTRLGFVARSRGSGRGFSPEELILDEAYALTDEQVSAVMPSISAADNPQIWYASSHPLVGSVVLRRICKRGRDEGRGLTYLEWSADPKRAHDDPEAWAEANPGYPDRIGDDSILRELGSMDPGDFARERLGVVDLDGAASRVVDMDLWASLADADSLALDPVAFALDISPDRSRASIAMGGRRGDGIAHVEVVDHRDGTGWIVRRLVELVRRWRPCTVVLDPAGQAGSLLKALDEAGFRTDPDEGDEDEPGEWRLQLVNTREAAQAVGALRHAIDNDGVRHLDQPSLNAALEGASTRPLADAEAWSRRDSSVDISPLVAATLALHGHATWGHEPEPEEPGIDFAIV